MEPGKHKLKINNSYESEPSSGSGSAASENNDYVTLEDDELDLPHLLMPRGQLHEYITEITNNPTLPKTYPGKLQFPKFYDTIVEENSCNAVYLPLSNEVEQNQQNVDSTKPKNTSDIDSTLITTASTTTTTTTTTTTATIASTANPTNNTTTTTTSDLTFNGKIKSLTQNENVKIKSNENLIDSQPKTLNIKTNVTNEMTTNTSYFTQKYICMKSPDLFEDDDENDLANYTGIILDNSEVQPPSTTIRDKIMTEETIKITAAPNTNTNTKHSNDYAETTKTTNSIKAKKMQNVDKKQTMLHEIVRRDRELLRRIRKCLSGIPPPPSFTTVQLNLFDAVVNKKDAILNFFNDSKTTKPTEEQKVYSLYKPTKSLELTKTLGWKDVLAVRQHGLSYNLSKATENSEYLSLSVIERYVASETSTSFRQSPTSAKKRNMRMKLLTQSPGSRLSHLAKRRTIFSSQNLATSGIKMNIGPQILIDKKKPKNRRKILTPKRKTPGSNRKTRKTPTSSARKRLFRTECPSRETSKRALFQSPAKKFEKIFSINPKPIIKPEIANRVEKSKRALFSPEKDSTDATTTGFFSLSNNSNDDKTLYKQPSLETLLNKRKRNLIDDYNDDDDDNVMRNKLFRGSSENLTPRALKIKSQSFCIGAGSSSNVVSSSSGSGSTSIENLMKMTNATTTTATLATATAAAAATTLSSSTSQLSFDSNKINAINGNGKMQRSHSEMAAPKCGLSESHRKKCLWAISIALQDRKITTSHENFRKFGCVLTRVVKRLFQEFYMKNSTSTSETMLRLAKKYVYYAISGRSADEIYLLAKTHITQTQRLSQRLSGYIGPEEYKQRKQLEQTFSESKSSLYSQLFTQTQTTSASSSLSNTQTSTINDKTPSMLSIFDSQSMIMDSGIVSSSIDDDNDDDDDGGGHNSSKISSFLSKDLANSCKKSTQLSIQPNPKLQNSSSKNNLNGLALRENVDGERRSAQKIYNSNSKEQNGSRIASPYNMAFGNNGERGSSTKQSNSEPKYLGAKAKRLICFDM